MLAIRLYIGRLLLPVTLFLAACGGDPVPAGPEAEPDPGPGPSGFYAGVFPCDGCPGNSVELLLHDNGYFFSRQDFRSGSAGTVSVATSLGRWLWFADDELLVLQSRGPERRFRMPSPDVLTMEAFAGGDHRLEQAVQPADFPGPTALSGTMEQRGDVVVFSECITGLSTPVEPGVEFNQYLRHRRRAGSPEGPLFAEFDGEYRWSSDGDPVSLIIRRFDTVRPGRSC